MQARNIPDDRKGELLKLVRELKAEVCKLATTHEDEASSITCFAQVSAHEVSRSQKNAELSKTALHGLRLSAQGLEESHPVVVGIVNSFATALSNLGL